RPRACTLFAYTTLFRSANIDEGAVLGGRYQVTGRVMASAQQDQVLTGIDQVLNREVLILVASTENASQAAQSARQLATGKRFRRSEEHSLNSSHVSISY